MANPNILTATQIFGKLFSNTITSVSGVASNATFSNTAGSNKIFNIKNIQIQGSVSGTAGYANIVCQGITLYSATGSQQIANTTIINKNTQIYLEENQSIVFTVYSAVAVATTLNYIISYEEIS